MSTPSISAPLAFINKEYPGQYQSGRYSVAVGTAPVQILPSNPERMSLAIMNIGGINIYISPEADVSNTKGMVLLANGGVFVSNVREDLTLVTQAWYAIAEVSGGQAFALDVYRFSLALAANPAIANPSK